jgi:beta-galactosidase/beta-glucuronidase
MTDLPDLAGPDLWSVADGPVLSRASIQVAMQHVHHDNVHHDGARVRTRAAALVRGVLPVPAGSAHRWSAESPYLYTLLISLYAGDELLEVIATLDCLPHHA